MQKVVVKFRAPVAVMENGKPVVKFDESEQTHLTASTKSTNNLLDDMKREGLVASDVIVKDFFLNKEETRKAVAELVGKISPEHELDESIIKHIMKALDGACVFKKPPIVRKK